ncbi:hypothetical protein [Clavibacter michiganensis]|uniref:hypothetical protein n=1 Tax=Clavibacter michiganensis TaxID=28447 RepID=UPI003D9FCECF
MADYIAASDDIRSSFSVTGEELVSRLRKELGFGMFVQAQDEVIAAAMQRDFVQAARLLPQVLPFLIDSTKRLREQGWATSFDVLRGGPLAAAALYPNEDVDRMLADIAADPATPDPAVHQKMLLLRKAMVAAAKALQEEGGPATKARIRERAGVTDGRLLSRALDWLVKAGLMFEVNGEYSTQGRPAPSAPPVDILSVAASVSVSAMSATLIHLLDYPRVAGPDTYVSSPPQLALPGVAIPLTVNDLVPTPMDLRPAGTARIAMTAGTTWLLTYKQPASALARLWTATIMGASGNLLRVLPLPAPVQSWSAGPDRNWVSVLSDDLHLRVYREGGELVTEIPLGRVPEISIRLAAGGAPWQLRVADHDLATGRTLVTFDDAVWLLGGDSRARWGVRVPEKAYPSGAWKPDEVPAAVRRLAVELGLPADLTAREAISYLSANGIVADHSAAANDGDGFSVEPRNPAAELLEELGELTLDRIESGRLTSTGATISTAYALNVDLNDDGEVARLWNTDSTLKTLSEQDRSRVGTTRRAIVEVTDDVFTSGAAVPARVGDRSGAPSPAHVLAIAAGDVVAGHGWIARLDGALLTVVSGQDRNTRTYQLPKKPSALVRHGSQLRVHIGAKHALIPLR